MPDPFEFGPWPHLAYLGSPLDRASERRGDAAFISEAIARAETRVVLVGREEIVLRRNSGELGDPLFEIAEAKALGANGEPVFLGLAQNAVRLGMAVPHEAMEKLKSRNDLLAADLRSIAAQGLVLPEHLPPVAAAKAVLAWHARHRFCANCGAPTRIAEAGWRRDCDSCGAQHFPRTDPCVIMLAIDGDRCLLARSSKFPNGMWSCLAGYMEPGESLEEAVRRETREETGCDVGRVVYFASQPWPFPMSLMIGCLAESTSTELRVDANEIEDARWVGREEAALMLTRRHPDGLRAPPGAAIAHHLIRRFVERGASALKRGSEES